MKTIKVNYASEIPENFTGVVEWNIGTKYWLKEGIFHREDGPAVEYPDGSKSWYKEGKRHRKGGPAVECSNGSKEWYREGNLHREDGPAVEEVDGTKEWYREGKLHRIDGPAVERLPTVDKNWYLKGKRYSQISLQGYLILDHYQGEYGIMWYKLLDKDKIFEYPDIPGLIIK